MAAIFKSSLQNLSNFMDMDCFVKSAKTKTTDLALF